MLCVVWSQMRTFNNAASTSDISLYSAIHTHVVDFSQYSSKTFHHLHESDSIGVNV